MKRRPSESLRRTFWLAWLHQDGKGFGLKLKSLPAGNPKTVMRTIEPKNGGEA